MTGFISHITSYIRNLRVRSLNKEFLIFFFFLILSTLFWFINTMNESYEMEIVVPVQLTKVPSNIVITTEIQDSLHVTMRDKGFALLKYFFKKDEKPIYVKFEDYNTSEYSGAIPTSALMRQIRSRFNHANITSVKPERLEFYYNYGKHKKVPVKLEGHITPAELYYLSSIRLLPDSVNVYAIESMLDSIKYAPTRPLNISNLSDTMTVSVNLVSIKGVKFAPNKVKVNLYPDIYAEADIEVPITCINLPPGKTLRTFPSKAIVHFVAGLKNMHDIMPSDFTVVTDYNEFAADTANTKCHLILQNLPDAVSRATLTITDIEYLIEE